MPLLGNDNLVRIDLPVEGEWVDVKRRMSRGDEIAIQAATMKGFTMPPALIERLAKPGVTAQEIGAAALEHGIDGGALIESASFAMLDVVIKAWSFDVPVTPEHIRALDGESVDAITVALNTLYPASRTDDDRKNSLEAGVPTPSGEATPRLSSAG